MNRSRKSTEGARRRRAFGLRSPAVRSALFPAFLLATAILHLSAIHDGHDWGGDFSLYLQHAENISTGESYGKTGYVRTPLMDYMSPGCYPPGFPLLLAPVRLALGKNMVAFKVEGILFLLGALLLFQLWARREIGAGPALLAAALFGWNPAVIEQSDRILSDIPFLFFLFLTAVVIERVWRCGRLGWGGGALAAALILFTTLVRPLGALLFLPFFGEGLRRGGLRARVPWGAAAGAAAGIVLVRLLLPGIAYAGLLDVSRNSIADNLAYYRFLMESFFSEIPFLPGTRYPLFLFLSALTAAGVAESLRRGRWPIPLFVLALLAVTVLFPYQQGQRYLIPVYPFLLAWMILGARWAGGVLPDRARRAAALSGSALLLLWTVYGIGASGVITRESPDGPESPPASAFLEFARDSAPENALFSFWKPRVLSYYTGRRAVAFPRLESLAEKEEWWRKWRVTHVVFDRLWMRDDDLLPRVAAREEHFRTVFDDGRFAVFAIEKGEGRKRSPAAEEKEEKGEVESDTLRRSDATEDRP